MNKSAVPEGRPPAFVYRHDVLVSIGAQARRGVEIAALGQDGLPRGVEVDGCERVDHARLAVILAHRDQAIALLVDHKIRGTQFTGVRYRAWRFAFAHRVQPVVRKVAEVDGSRSDCTCPPAIFVDPASGVEGRRIDVPARPAAPGRDDHAAPGLRGAAFRPIDVRPIDMRLRQRY